MLDTAAGVWLDRNGLVTSSKPIKGHAEYDPTLDLMRRCRHASASVGARIYVHGGLKGGKIVCLDLVKSSFHYTVSQNLENVLCLCLVLYEN